jgi:hypothetical protein
MAAADRGGVGWLRWAWGSFERAMRSRGGRGSFL